MEFTEEEIETIKDIINEHGFDCPGTDYNKVLELQYKLGLRIRPTPEEIVEQEKRRKEFAESDLGKLSAAMFERSNVLFLEQQKEWEKDQLFIDAGGIQWPDNFKIGSTLRIRLPSDYVITNGPVLCKLSLWQKLKSWFKNGFKFS